MTHDELELAGWTRQATYDEPRLSEMAETYRELGFEVRVEPFQLDGSAECSECMRLEPQRFRTIYTRKMDGD
jgi:predicted P-loop ATPase